MLIDAAVGLAGDGGSDDVVDCEHAVTFSLGFAQRGQGVDRLAGLAHDKKERVAIERRVAVAELRGVIHLDGKAGKALDQMLGHEAGVPSGAAGAKHEPIYLAQLGRSQI